MRVVFLWPKCAKKDYKYWHVVCSAFWYMSQKFAPKNTCRFSLVLSSITLTIVGCAELKSDFDEPSENADVVAPASSLAFELDPTKSVIDCKYGDLNRYFLVQKDGMEGYACALWRYAPDEGLTPRAYYRAHDNENFPDNSNYCGSEETLEGTLAFMKKLNEKYQTDWVCNINTDNIETTIEEPEQESGFIHLESILRCNVGAIHTDVFFLKDHDPKLSSCIIQQKVGNTENVVSFEGWDGEACREQGAFIASQTPNCTRW